MRFHETAIEGVLRIEPEMLSDERGAFARVFCAETFKAHGLPQAFTQHSLSYNRLKGTLRGLHYQKAPYAEAKLVRCTRGSVFDVAVDLRPASPSFGKHVAAELSADNRAMLFIPPGCAHGFLTLEDETDLFYEITPDFVAGAAAGIAFDDAELAIGWPIEPRVISERDRALPSFQSFRHEASSRDAF